MQVEGYLQGVLVTFLNVYAPPGSESKFCKQIFSLLISEDKHILICGEDFNVRLHLTEDTQKPYYTEKKTTKSISN